MGVRRPSCEPEFWLFLSLVAGRESIHIYTHTYTGICSYTPSDYRQRLLQNDHLRICIHACMYLCVCNVMHADLINLPYASLSLTSRHKKLNLLMCLRRHRSTIKMSECLCMHACMYVYMLVRPAVTINKVPEESQMSTVCMLLVCMHAGASRRNVVIETQFQKSPDGTRYPHQSMICCSAADLIYICFSAALQHIRPKMGIEWRPAIWICGFLSTIHLLRMYYRTTNFALCHSKWNEDKGPAKKVDKLTLLHVRCMYVSM